MSVFSSRYFLTTDAFLENFSWKDLNWDFRKLKWWSRIYEYQWVNDVCKEFDKRRSAVDVGTGDEHPGVFLLKSHGFKRVVGIDLIKKSEWKYREYLGNGIKYVSGDIANGCSGKYDLVMCISTLEHIHPRTQPRVLKNLMSLVDDGGILLLTFDMPGCDYKTYLEMLKEFNFSVILEDEGDIPIVKTTNSAVQPSPRTKKLFCYRICATRNK